MTRKRKRPFRRIKFVSRRSSPLLKCVVLAAIVLSAAVLILIASSIRSAEKEAEALRQEAGILEQENNKLEDKIDDLGSIDSIKDIAQEELDLVDPDTEFFTPEIE